jgi:hypothetical protein
MPTFIPIFPDAEREASCYRENNSRFFAIYIPIHKTMEGNLLVATINQIESFVANIF